MTPLTAASLREQVSLLNEMARRDQANANRHRELAEAFETKAEAQRNAADVIEGALNEAAQ